MTREKALKVLEMFLFKQCDLARTKFAYDANTVWDAVNMALEALEQKNVLEDIRAEIEAYEKELLLSKRDEDVVAELAVNQCLDIIDKHLNGEIRE